MTSVFPTPGTHISRNGGPSASIDQRAAPGHADNVAEELA